MNKEEIQKLFKDNPIKVIKYGDIEIPVEYLKQTTININGDDYIKLQQENKLLKDKYNLRERKWEKWNTEKSILSSKMSEYLCKYQNIKREYKNQNDCLCKYKAENQLLKHRLTTANDFIEDRKENMIPEHYDDLKYIINECDLNSSW